MNDEVNREFKEFEGEFCGDVGLDGRMI